MTQGSENPAKLRGMFDFDKLDIELLSLYLQDAPPLHTQRSERHLSKGISNSIRCLLSQNPNACFDRGFTSTSARITRSGIGSSFWMGGGGTVCLVRYVLESIYSPQFRHEFESIVCGAETISNKFEKLAANKIPADCPNRDWVIDRMRRLFDEFYKHTFDGNNSDIPVTVLQQEFSKCFDSQGQRADYLVLEGGLCHNEYVKKVIKTKFDKSIKIKCVTADKNHVLGPLGHHLDIDTDDKTGQNYFFVVQWLAKKGELAESRLELSSESSYQKSRYRTILMKQSDPEFNDKILIVDYHPGNSGFSIVGRDGKLLNDMGHPLANYEEHVTITWHPARMGVRFGNLAVKIRNRVLIWRDLRYSIQVMLEMGSTKVWIKAWDLEKMHNTKTATAKVSEAAITKAIFDHEKISESLLQSFRLGNGISRPASNSILNRLATGARKEQFMFIMGIKRHDPRLIIDWDFHSEDSPHRAPTINQEEIPKAAPNTVRGLRVITEWYNEHLCEAQKKINSSLIAKKKKEGIIGRRRPMRLSKLTNATSFPAVNKPLASHKIQLNTRGSEEMVQNHASAYQEELHPSKLRRIRGPTVHDSPPVFPGGTNDGGYKVSQSPTVGVQQSNGQGQRRFDDLYDATPPRDVFDTRHDTSFTMLGSSMDAPK
ncbi:hypothetical protein G7Y89_g7810 [Cudoniella acicularis]|uniref:Uncharacterized protein n=1 Tax=Cudoniella acicularis TaxID=354080 RepID=A0A8H4W1L8_9HELO|nr:hypothetical protein G7Y89_g7810 [Cudoniella acicularis]